jgi:two-component system chemotaxis response regulator CheB
MIKAIVIGASYGGMEAIRSILVGLKGSVQIPVMVVLHIGNNNIDTYISSLNKKTGFLISEAGEKDKMKAGYVYFAPPNYHLQVEDEQCLSLSTDEKVNFSRPSIDVLFETAAWVFKGELLGVLLTGANSDGAEGLRTIKRFGGKTIVQDPETALAKIMPLAAINLAVPDFILPLDQISQKILELIS